MQEDSVGLQVCPTLFTVTVPPVHPASGVPKKAPRSDPAVRVATVVVLSYTFSRVALLEAGHIGPVHAPVARLGDVYRSAVKTVFSAALDAGRERQDEWRNAAGATEAAVRSQKRGHEREKKQILNHIRSPVTRSRDLLLFNHQPKRPPVGFIPALAAGLWGARRGKKTMRINQTPNGQAVTQLKFNNALQHRCPCRGFYVW